MRSHTQYLVERYGQKTTITRHNSFAKQDTCWRSKFDKFLESIFLYRVPLEQQQTRKLYQILLDLELHISLFSARIPKQTRRYYLVVSMIQEWMLQ